MGNRLLLADDSITIQKVVAIIFANEEFELTVVDNGTAALEKAREIRPDVMLVDALMPGKTGYEVCSEIRRDPALSSVPILLLIGAFEPLDEEKARDCGADASISKPFESQQLIDRVKEMLELGKSRSSAAPAARELPIESAAEELWGDLSSFDTMPPAEAPAAAAAPPRSEPAREHAAPAAFAAPAAARPEPPSAPQPAPFTPPPAPVAPVAAVPYQEELVEASFEDDLWGAFEAEEEPAVSAAPPSQLFGVVEPESSEFEAEEFFSFEDDADEIEETGPALDLELGFVEPTEELFSFEEPVPSGEPEPEFKLPEYDPFSFEPEELEPAAPFAAEPAEPAVEPVAAPVAAPEPVPSAAAFAAEPAEPRAGIAEAKAPAAAALSEADLVAALSKISREVIERIVWEVVPDLAEALIREELKKLKAGVRG